MIEFDHTSVVILGVIGFNRDQQENWKRIQDDTTSRAESLFTLLRRKAMRLPYAHSLLPMLLLLTMTIVDHFGRGVVRHRHTLRILLQRIDHFFPGRFYLTTRIGTTSRLFFSHTLVILAHTKQGQTPRVLLFLFRIADLDCS